MNVIQGEELGECRVAGVTMQSSFRSTAVLYPDAILRPAVHKLVAKFRQTGENLIN